MLHSISWLQFSAFLFFGLVIYYGYVLFTYYRDDIWKRGRMVLGLPQSGGSAGDRQKRAKGGLRGQVGTMGSVNDMMKVGRDLQEATSEDEMFKVAEKLTGKLSLMLGQAFEEGLTWDELEERLRGILGGYKQLSDTPHQAAVNEFIVRRCMGWMNPPVLADEVKELWE